MDIDKAKLADKRTALEELLRTHRSVHVWVDGRVASIIPPWGRNKPAFVLQLGYDLPIPIHDLDVDESGWSGTLSFNRQPFFCAVPWEAVYMVIGEGTDVGASWPHDIPQEVFDELFDKQHPPKEKKSKKLPPGWGVIDGGKK